MAKIIVSMAKITLKGRNGVASMIMNDKEYIFVWREDAEKTLSDFYYAYSDELADENIILEVIKSNGNPHLRIYGGNITQLSNISGKLHLKVEQN